MISFANTSGADTNSSPVGIRILINNKILQCEQPPVIVNDCTLVPMRAIFEALGAGNNITVNGEASKLNVSM